MCWYRVYSEQSYEAKNIKFTAKIRVKVLIKIGFFRYS